MRKLVTSLRGLWRAFVALERRTRLEKSPRTNLK